MWGWILNAAKAIGSWLAQKTIAAAFVRTVLVNVAIAVVQKSLMSKGSGGGTLDNLPQNVTLRSTVPYRRILYGQRRVSGVLAFYGVSSSGVTPGVNDRFGVVVVLAGHQVEEIGDVWVDNVRIPSTDIDSAGNVLAGQYAGAMRIWKHLGTAGQAADVNLVADYPTEWSTDHRLAGCAYLYIRCGKSDTAFPQGAPQQFGALVKGRLVYDPRLDSTNGGSGSHRMDDATTWEYSANPALILRDWITGGSIVNDQVSPLRVYGILDSDDRIDDVALADSADVCDEVLTGINATPDGDAVRYECHLEVSADATNRSVFTDILETMAGTAVIRKGQWVIEAGRYIAPVHTLTEANIYNELRVYDTDPQRDRYNAVSATFTDASKGYVEATCKQRTDSTYEAQDGNEQLPMEITLRGVTDQYQAQRLCEIKLRQSRMMRRVTIVGARDLLKIGLNEAFTLTFPRYGWTSRIFRCTDRQFEFSEDAGRVTIDGRRDDSGVWTDLLTGDYVTGASSTDVFQTDGPSTPLSLTITSMTTGILLSWTTDGNDDGVMSEVWEYTSATPFGSATRITTTASKFWYAPKTDTTARYYWVRRVNAAGQISGTYPSSSGTSGAAGTVGTGQITSNAATETYNWSVAGPVTLTTDDTTPVSPYDFVNTTVTAAVDSVGILRAQAHIDNTSLPFDNVNFGVLMSMTTSPFTGDSKYAFVEHDANVVVGGAVYLALQAGKTYQIYVRYQFENALSSLSGQTSVATDVFATLEIIKR